MREQTPLHKPIEHNQPLSALSSLILPALQESGLHGPKLEWIDAYCFPLLTQLPAELREEFCLALEQVSRSALIKPNHTFLQPSGPLPLFLAQTLIGALTRTNLGQKGLEDYVKPYVNTDQTLVLVANQRAWTDSAVVASVLEMIAYEKIVEVACRDSFPNPLVQGLFQGGRHVVHTPASVKQTFGAPLELLSGSPFQALCSAVRIGKWPLLFPEALNAAQIESTHQLRRQNLHVPKTLPFSSHLFEPWMSDDLATCGVDPESVLFAPVKILDSEWLPQPNGVLPNEEFDTIVKFGKPIPLVELKERFSHIDPCKRASAVAQYLRQAVEGLGEHYLD